MEYQDVIILGAGISGIDMAYHLKTFAPKKTFTVLERRESFGGTWDVFKYPGVRSDSDMFTFGYAHKPWPSPKPIAPGGDIKAYLKEAIEEEDLQQHILFNHHAIKGDWSSENKLWTIFCSNGKIFKCKFIFTCTGYYNQDAGYLPNFKGMETFKGQIIHPQHWDVNLNYQNKKIVVIGSGATAITLIPNLKGAAKPVTMLQRSPTYIMSRINLDEFTDKLLKSDKYTLKEAHAMVREHKVQEGKRVSNDIIYIYIIELVYH